MNTLTSPELGTPTAAGLGTGTNNASVLDLAGFQSAGATPPPTPWDGGCWDLVFTGDDPMSRPDPVLGQLQPGGSYYSLIPLVQASFSTANPPVPPGDPVIFPLPQAPPQTGASLSNYFTGDPTKTPVAPYYFLTIGNPLPAGAEVNPFVPTYTLNSSWDPVSSPAPTGSVLPPAGGVLPTPVGGTVPLTYPKKISTAPSFPGRGTGNGAMFWVCLRRPANPFAPVTAANPMIVVDAMRFPVIEGGGTAGSPPSLTNANQIFSYQRLQPFRGGHAVPMPGVTGALDPRYGYSEQIAVPTTLTKTVGQYEGQPITKPIYNSLGLPNDGTVNLGSAGPPVVPQYLNEPWDYFPFNDRDFTSVAELLMVPGCPPGLFTKQFAEFAPSSANVTGYLQPCHAPGNPPRKKDRTDRLLPKNDPNPNRSRDGVEDFQRGRGPNPSADSAHVPLPGGQVLLHRGFPDLGHDVAVRRPHRRRLVQNVRVLRGAQPDDRRSRPSGPGHQLRLAAPGHQAGADQPQPHHRRGGLLQRLW